ncbi:hypothetical protein J6590_009688 [Homalodisca vitripennis]|nr:hypothetical protein J6590_009688 [Homalodisca vitripennis]
MKPSLRLIPSLEYFQHDKTTCGPVLNYLSTVLKFVDQCSLSNNIPVPDITTSTLAMVLLLLTRQQYLLPLAQNGGGDKHCCCQGGSIDQVVIGKHGERRLRTELLESVIHLDAASVCEQEKDEER